MSSRITQELSCSQNFLHDTALVASLIERAGIGPNDLVVEIGPGRGIITARLAQACRRVLAIEKDPCLAAALRASWAGQTNLRLVEGDFLNFPLPEEPYKVFASIPFNLTAAIVARLTAAKPPPQEAFLVMQREAAQTYLGLPHECLRSLLLKPWFALEVIHHFRRSDFSPSPRVDTVLLRLQRRRSPLVACQARVAFRDFVVYNFTAWQPNLGGLLKRLFTHPQRKRILIGLGIDPASPPSLLTLDQWLALFDCFHRLASPEARQRVAGSEQRLARQQARLKKVHRTRVSRC
jgi:23S rRNA (adenine-N6)-dimethyltransferase